MAKWEYLAASYLQRTPADEVETKGGVPFRREPGLEALLAAFDAEGWELVTIHYERAWILLRRLLQSEKTEPFGIRVGVDQDVNDSQRVGKSETK